MNAFPAPSSICLTPIPPPIETATLAITSLQPLKRMALGTAIVAAAPANEPATCLPVRLPTRALLLVLALSIHSGLALNLRTGFGKMICKGFCFLRRVRLVVLSGFTSINSSITIFLIPPNCFWSRIRWQRSYNVEKISGV